MCKPWVDTFIKPLALTIGDFLVKLIIFDLGGVVIDFVEHYAYSYISKKLGISYGKVASVISALLYNELEYGDLTNEEFLDSVSKALGVNKRKLYNAWEESFKTTAKPKQDTIRLVKKLSKHYTVVSLSNITESRYFLSLELFDRHIFYKIFASCFLHARKPEAKVYKKVLESMHTAPEDAVFIDNLAENVQGAERVGIRSILFYSAKQAERELAKLGVR